MGFLILSIKKERVDVGQPGSMWVVWRTRPSFEALDRAFQGLEGLEGRVLAPAGKHEYLLEVQVHEPTVPTLFLRQRAAPRKRFPAVGADVEAVPEVEHDLGVPATNKFGDSFFEEVAVFADGHHALQLEDYNVANVVLQYHE